MFEARFSQGKEPSLQGKTFTGFFPVKPLFLEYRLVAEKYSYRDDSLLLLSLQEKLAALAMSELYI